MYDSCRCYHDKLSRSGCRGFHLDPEPLYRTDHIYSWESVPCSFAGTLYVWCCSKLLRAYQKFLIVLACMLSLSFPVFAEDEAYNYSDIGLEAMANQGYDVNSYLNEQYTEQKNAEIAQILSEPLANNTLLANNSSDSDFAVESVSVVDNGNSSNPIRIVFDFLGTRPESLYIYRTLPDYNVNGFFQLQGNYVDARVPFIMKGVYTSPSTDSYNYFPGEYTFNTDSIGSTVYSPVGIFYTFLDTVRECFTWILSHISELITFILGNAFLSVSLLLFMCGAVVSFYVRIRRS